MAYTHTIVGHFPSHTEAEMVVLELQKEGFDLQKLSLIGKDYQTTEDVRGFLTWKDTAIAGAIGGGYWGSFVGGLFGILAGGRVLYFFPARLRSSLWVPGWLEGTLIGGAAT